MTCVQIAMIDTAEKALSLQRGTLTPEDTVSVREAVERRLIPLYDETLLVLTAASAEIADEIMAARSGHAAQS
jgi:hypothetical protein